MSAEVKRERPYESPRRQEQARQTRLQVLRSAQELFLGRGYAQTTMPAVAADAGVSVETVYKAFGNKPGLVKAVFDVAIAGDDQPIPLEQRAVIQRIIAEPDPAKKLASYGHHVGKVVSRTGRILLVVREAAATDEGAATVWESLQAERLSGMTSFVTHLDEGGHLRAGVSRDEARDVLWTHNSVELWDLLVEQRHWGNRRFGRWVGHQLVAALL